MGAKEYIQILEHLGGLIRESHVVYASGLHGDAYINKDALYPHTNYTKWFCDGLAKGFADESVDVVVGPELGGIILSQHVAHHLTNMAGRDILSLYAEKLRDGTKGFHFNRGYDAFIRDSNVLIVEDVLTTGGSVRKVVEAVRACGGVVTGVAALCNRGNVTCEQLGGVPRLHSLFDLEMNSYTEEECPLCATGIPIRTDIGKGASYLKKLRFHAKTE
ncbi:MAG: phosphoribosyltransferase [Candidatus Magasanikbacteria bacterium]|nr:phosphoribosyltransferase [Candidatus Magasanikbacteria bacterium]MCA9391059.1 phosphoribosyltransferase [Candidatus Magasanikbacteria bacterium]USN52578.1 MAG: phosphoribosyltransferase [Candidatus Nomurabacteria bacterium]HPF95357.1 phosphoribosyltransferase family protein [bacterium]